MTPQEWGLPGCLGADGRECPFMFLNYRAGSHFSLLTALLKHFDG